jgi:predicted RNase H-like nuclease
VARAYAGVDGTRGGWVAIVIDESGYLGAQIGFDFVDLVRGLDATVVAVDIPIGVSETFPRRADELARELVGPRRSSVFFTPPRSVLEAPDYESARRIGRDRHGIGVSAQSYALASRILEVAAVAQSDDRVIEVHPEVSFAAMAGEPLSHPKTTWDGIKLREVLLENEGIGVPGGLGAPGRARPDDILEPAAAAWSARRHALQVAKRLPGIDENEVTSAIWY